jgi:membrane protease YdiL (CAAX protease family)
MKTETEVITPPLVDKYTIFALLIGLVAYPVLYSMDFFDGILFLILPPQLSSSLLDENSRTEWWYFIFSNIAFHWIPFFCIWIALSKNGEQWTSVGVDWTWFVKYKNLFVALLLILIVAALVMPSIYYGEDMPLKSQAGFMGPISSIERIFIILLALTAAVAEEVIFRGFALTRLKRFIPNPWIILPITVISFLFIHGEVRSLGQALNYIIAGLAFGIPFILMGLKRLEILILIHFLINSSLVFVP